MKTELSLLFVYILFLFFMNLLKFVDVQNNNNNNNNNNQKTQHTTETRMTVSVLKQDLTGKQVNNFIFIFYFYFYAQSTSSVISGKRSNRISSTFLFITVNCCFVDLKNELIRKIRTCCALSY